VEINFLVQVLFLDHLGDHGFKEWNHDRSLGTLRAADERAYGKLRDLKASPYAIKLSDLEEQNVFASRNGVFSQWNSNVAR
jgi:hypothetical protein